MLPLSHRGRRVLRAAPAAALALVLAQSPPALAGPTERLRDFFAAVNAILSDPETERDPLERVARVRGLVADVADVDRAASVALGREWQARSPLERREFVALFAELLERAYVGGLAGRARVENGIRIAYLGESIADDEATVRTSVGARIGGESRIEYRMVNRQGGWRVYDLVLDGVSTAENYRAQFRRLLRQAPYQDLVGQIKTKLAGDSLMFARAVGRHARTPAPGPTELVLIALPDDWTIARDRQPPVVRAAVPLRSRDIGWNTGVSYWVQAGAFTTATAAERLAERLGGGAVVSSDGGRLLLVRVGPFAQRAQAVTRLRELEALGYRPSLAEVSP